MTSTKYSPLPNEIYHVHTWRCKHAGEVQDFEYIEKAIELKAPRIVFTDHCPFPGDPFEWRMDMAQLPEYVDSMKKLRRQYDGKIEVLCGLEVEYLPSFCEYYKELRSSNDFDLLMLAPHFFEYSAGHYDFQDADRTNSYIGLCDALVEGINSGFFDVIAHPDRVFRAKKSFDNLAAEGAKKVIDAAIGEGLYMEKNYTSMRLDRQYWPEFWTMVPNDAKILYGYDAHSIEDMIIPLQH